LKSKPVIPRALPGRDVDEALAYYLKESSNKVASGFIEALEKAYAHIGRHPATGSPRYAHELGIPGLRSWTLVRFPYIVFYVERAEYIDVWRVLNSHSNLPAWMGET
jgi:toxin ParE1/3/4